jgi:hypothetical protein
MRNVSHIQICNAQELCGHIESVKTLVILNPTGSIVTLCRCITIFYGTDSVLQNVPHIEIECESHSAE